MIKPLVSILMPVYNSFDFVRSEGAQLLPKALDSLLAQTYENFELIILDNQSTDSTADICKKYAKKDSRIRYFFDTEKRFPEGAINHLATLMTGKYCMVANDDDLWHPDYIRKLTMYLQEHPQIDLVYSNSSVIDIKGKKRGIIITSEMDSYGNICSPLSNYCEYIWKRDVIPILFGIFKAESYI
jgi:glycosyltransferase involved in cell wall biosynthesis